MDCVSLVEHLLCLGCAIAQVSVTARECTACLCKMKAQCPGH